MVILIMEARMRDVRSRSMIKPWRAYWLAGIVRHAEARRHRHHQPCTDNPGGLGAQSADGDVAGLARRLVVGTETRGRGLFMPRGHIYAPALADHFRGIGFRPRRARQHQPFLTLAAALRGKTRTRFAALSTLLASRRAVRGKC